MDNTISKQYCISDEQLIIHQITELLSLLVIPILIIISTKLDGWLLTFMYIYIAAIIVVDGGLLINWTKIINGN